jgi:hypothetical protein
MGEPDLLYRVFDLVLKSNIPIPGLRPLEKSDVPTVTVHFGTVPDGAGCPTPSSQPAYQSPYRDDSGAPIVRIWCLSDTTYQLSYVNGLNFTVNYANSEIWSTWPEDVLFQDAASYLLGPVLGIFLRLRKRICLHASAVAYKDRAIVFAGSPGAGKSTLAAAFSCRGLAVLSDDIVLLEKDNQAQFCAIPSHPFLSLWPESVELIKRKPEELPLIFSQVDKRRLVLETPGRFESRSLPIGAIYVLDNERAAAGRVEDLTGQDALVSLITESYGTYVLDLERRVQELDALSELISKTAIFCLPSERKSFPLEQLCEMVLHHYDRRNRYELR